MTREGEHTEVIDQRARGHIRTVRARARRSAVAVAMFLGALAVPVLTATPALASSYTCTSANDPICQSLTPTFNCVWHDTAGNWTAVFGYQNDSSTYDITVPVGQLNTMSPGAGDLGQLTYFPRGAVGSAFTVPFTPPRLTWSLVGKTATATSSDKTCASPPVPAFGSPGVLLRTALIALPMLLVVARTRRVQTLVAAVPSVFGRVA
jgi:hypothetical protein